MPIVIDEMKLPITPAEARDIIQRQTDNFGVFFDVDRCYEIAAILQLENKDIVRDLRRLSLDPTLFLDDKLKVIDTLTSMGVSKVDFYGGCSLLLDMRRELKKIDHMFFLSHEMVRSYFEKYCPNLNSLLDSCKLVNRLERCKDEVSVC